METRDEILRTMAGAYKKATRKEKGRMLDHVVEVAGYNRAYASHRLCLYGKRLFLRGCGGSQVILEAEREKVLEPGAGYGRIMKRLLQHLQRTLLGAQPGLVP
jgi:hypothetical protein